MTRRYLITSFFGINAALLLALGSWEAAANGVTPPVQISQPARGQGDVGLPRRNPVDSVLSGGVLPGLPSTSVSFDRCAQDDTQLGCANYCSAHPGACAGSGGGGAGQPPASSGQWEYESGSWGYGAGPSYDYIQWSTTSSNGWCGNGGQRPPQGSQSCDQQPNLSAPCTPGDWLAHYMNEGFGGGSEGSEQWVCR